MAITPFRAKITRISSFTIPAGKRAVFAAFLPQVFNYVTGASRILLRIDGVDIAFMAHYENGTPPTGFGTPEVKPLTATAGEVVSVDSTSDTLAVSIVGHLYDL
jgi:hypothetical protein